MCGLFGLIMREQKLPNQYDILADGLYFSGLRGQDGTGWLGLSETSFASVKRAQPPGEFVGPYIRGSRHLFRFLGGHVRSATLGICSDEYTHPHEQAGKYLFHNGTLVGHKKYGESDSDSKNFLTCIIERGLKAALEEVTGSFAIVYVDIKVGKISFARNNDRPLVFREAEDGVVLYASESCFISGAAERNKLKLVGDVITLPPGEIWTYDIADLSTAQVERFTPSKALISYYKYYDYDCDYDHTCGWYDSMSRNALSAGTNKKYDVNPKFLPKQDNSTKGITNTPYKSTFSKLEEYVKDVYDEKVHFITGGIHYFTFSLRDLIKTLKLSEIQPQQKVTEAQKPVTRAAVKGLLYFKRSHMRTDDVVGICYFKYADAIMLVRGLSRNGISVNFPGLDQQILLTCAVTGIHHASERSAKVPLLFLRPSSAFTVEEVL